MSLCNQYFFLANHFLLEKCRALWGEPERVHGIGLTAIIALYAKKNMRCRTTEYVVALHKLKKASNFGNHAWFHYQDMGSQKSSISMERC